MRVRPLLAGIVQIQIHLTGVGVRELAELQIYYNETLKPAMEEDQIDSIPFVSDAQSPLASDEGEIVSHL